MTADASTQIRVLTAAIEAAEALDPEGMARVYAQDVVFEFPFAPPEFPTKRIEGRAALLEFFRTFPKYYREVKIVDRTFSPLADGSGLVAEYAGRWVSHKGVPYDNQYIAVARFRGDQIVHMREFFNPLVWQESLTRARG